MTLSESNDSLDVELCIIICCGSASQDPVPSIVDYIARKKSCVANMHLLDVSWIIQAQWSHQFTAALVCPGMSYDQICCVNNDIINTLHHPLLP